MANRTRIISIRLVLLVPVDCDRPSEPPPRPCRLVETTGEALSPWTPVVHEGGKAA